MTKTTQTELMMKEPFRKISETIYSELDLNATKYRCMGCKTIITIYTGIQPKCPDCGMDASVTP